MKIAIVVFPCVKVARFSRGLGYCIYHLIDGLKRRGHQVTLFANRRSRVPCRLFSLNLPHPRFDLELLHIQNAVKRAKEFDLINIQIDHRGSFFADHCPVPILNTVIYGGFGPETKFIFKANRQHYYQAISKSLTRLYPWLNWQGVVYLGLKPEDYKFNAEPQDYLLCLARVVPEKGLDQAIRVARLVKRRLIIAGDIPESQQAYFDQEIKPRLNKQITYVGAVNFRQKVRLLRQAEALLHPVQCPEGFGNALIEAMACGTPVIAFRRGATAETIRQGQTGFLVDSTKAMAQAVGRLSQIRRQDCRQWVEKNFTVDRMVLGYEKIYQQVITKFKTAKK